MIRKDFILQNYVGTGGNCDARAVRCHERIARWHAMCEHQLSHINEFVVQQVCRMNRYLWWDTRQLVCGDL